MDAKKFIKNKSFCVLPWTGFMLYPSGIVTNCVISKNELGHIEDNSIEQIMANNINKQLKKDMNADAKPSNCSGCHYKEASTKSITGISDRLYYNREIARTFDENKEFELQTVDLRWTNACNQACVYCSPAWSSKWATELGRKVKSNKLARERVKKYVFDNVLTLKNVYLAGGEPMMMNENKEFLTLLLEKNPDVHLRINTNLSYTNTGVFELVCQFKNVHWIISGEAIEHEYEYIRHHGNWQNFYKNIKHIQTLGHKVTFNMLYFILNYKSLFDTVAFFKNEGFHENSFIIGPMLTPEYLNILNLPDRVIDDIKIKLTNEINNTNFYLKNSYQNLLKYINDTTWQHDPKNFYKQIEILDKRRNQNSRLVFPKLYEDLND
jgi:radical SAM protein with 4Fe4S-binding SPASM domain